MPLPKTASIAARATDVYSEACPLVMKSLKEKVLHNELPLLLPYLRQLLTCCACAGPLEDPMLSLSCGHCYCYKCQFGEPLLKIHCRQCKQREGLVINSQLRIIASLYRQLIHVLAVTTPLDHALQELVTEVLDGVKVSRSMFFILPPDRYRLCKLTTPIKPRTKTSPKIDHVRLSLNEPGDELLHVDEPIQVHMSCLPSPLPTDRANHFLQMTNLSLTHSVVPLPPLSINTTRHPLTPSITRKKRPLPPHSPSEGLVIPTVSMVTTLKATPTASKKRRKGRPPSEYICHLSNEEIEELKKESKYCCRCGTNPGVLFEHLICMKKKCPCFYNQLPCLKCRCKGCCNPYKIK